MKAAVNLFSVTAHAPNLLTLTTKAGASGSTFEIKAGTLLAQTTQLGPGHSRGIWKGYSQAQ